MAVMKHPDKMRKEFYMPLRSVGILTWLNAILIIPYEVINAKLLSNIINEAINGNIHQVLKYSLIILLFTVVFKLVLTGLSLLKSMTDMRSFQRCKMILYHHILKSPLDLLFSCTNGSMLENVTDDLDTVTSAQRYVYPTFFTAIITSAVYLTVIGMQSFIIMLALLIISFLQIIPPIIIRKFMQKNYDANREAETKITDFTVAGYEGMAIIKMFSLRRWYLDKLKHIHAEAQRAGKNAELTGAAQSSMSALVDNLLQYGTYAVIGIAVFASQATIGVGIQAIALSGGLFRAIKSIFDCIPQFALVNRSEERLSKWFNQYATRNIPVKNERYALLLKNISYHYDSDMVFNHLNFHMKNNDRVLLKGKNGAGKTTLLRLITGLLPLQTGTITFGCSDGSHSSSFWGSVLFYLPQEDIVFDITPAELCRMLKIIPDVSDFQEWGLPKTIIVSSSIADLSGGERKKVYLAIAFLLNPRILILDEPSNSLDGESVKVLHKKLLQRLRSTLIISHDERLNALPYIHYQLEDGEIRIEK